MRAAMVVVVIVAAGHLVDRLALHGHYTQAVWLEASGYAQQLNADIDRWVKRTK